MTHKNLMETFRSMRLSSIHSNKFAYRHSNLPLYFGPTESNADVFITRPDVKSYKPTNYDIQLLLNDTEVVACNAIKYDIMFLESIHRSKMQQIKILANEKRNKQIVYITSAIIVLSIIFAIIIFF